MSRTEIYLTTTQFLIEKITDFKNNIISKKEFNNNMLINLAYLLGALSAKDGHELLRILNNKNSDNQQIKKTKETTGANNLIDVYFPKTRLSYSNENQFHKELWEASKNDSNKSSNQKNNNSDSNINNKSNDTSIYKEFEFLEKPLTACNTTESQSKNEEDEFEILNKLEDIDNAELLLDVPSNEKNDGNNNNNSNLTSDKLSKFKNTVNKPDNNLEEIENDLYYFLPTKKIEYCPYISSSSSLSLSQSNPNNHSSSPFNNSNSTSPECIANNIIRYRKAFIAKNPKFSELPVLEDYSLFCKTSTKKKKDKNDPELLNLKNEFKNILPDKIIFNYFDDMCPLYIRQINKIFIDILNKSTMMEILEDKLYLNMFKSLILEIGICDKRNYEDTLRNVIYKKNSSSFEVFLSCFSKILKLKDENSIMKYKYLLFITKYGNDGKYNKHNIKQFFELISCKKIYDKEIFEEIKNEFLERYHEIYPNEKGSYYPEERLMLVLESFFDNHK